MRREDLGFVVSRALAVWIGAIGIRGLYPVLDGMLQLWGSSSKYGNHNDSYLLSLFVSEAVVVAAQIALGVLLWTKASSFARGGDNEPASEPMAIGKNEIQIGVMSAVGLILLVQGLATVGSVIVDQYYVKELGGLKQTSARTDWQGSAFEAAIGLLVLVTCQYPDWFRRLLSYANYPRS